MKGSESPVNNRFIPSGQNGLSPPGRLLPSCLRVNPTHVAPVVSTEGSKVFRSLLLHSQSDDRPNQPHVLFYKCWSYNPWWNTNIHLTHPH